VSWAKETRSGKSLSILNLGLFIPKGTLKGLYSYMFLLQGKECQILICFRDNKLCKLYTGKDIEAFLSIQSRVNCHWLKSCLPF
jgi:hypothetical protein